MSEAPSSLVHATEGRLRIRLPGWSRLDRAPAEAYMLACAGVTSASAGTRTGNVLVHYDASAVDADQVLAHAVRFDAALVDPELVAALPDARRQKPSALDEGGEGTSGRVRIAVRGLDRNGRLAATVVRKLAARPGVQRVSASALTGRVLVEYDTHQVQLDELLAHVTRLELPELPGEDRPAHPLDPTPLIQSSARLGGAAAGLGLLAARRIAGAGGPPVESATPVVLAGLIGAVEGLPALRDGVRGALGRGGAEILFSGLGAVSLTFAGSPLGLAVVGAGALRVFTEVRGRRAAWRSYEQRLGDAPEAHPGLTVHLSSGERTPLRCLVIAGAGTRIATDGLPRSVSPGDTLHAGTRLRGGPFELELQPGIPFDPEPRPAALPEDLRALYGRALSPVTLGYALLTGVLTRSPARALTAMLLVNSRPALIGAEASDIGAAARVVRAGVTVVGTRSTRVIRRPDLLLLDGASILTERLEVSAMIPLGAEDDQAKLLALAGGVASACGSPWGPVFPPSGRATAIEGSFAGGAASAVVGGRSYRLAPADGPDEPAVIQALHARGEYGLVLSEVSGDVPVAAISLRARPLASLADLRASCARHRTELALICSEQNPALAAFAGRAGVAVIVGDTLAEIRTRQREGFIVALASESADAAEAFAACDLAIGVTSGRSARFAARADMLAPDLQALGAIVDAGGRRELAIRDGVALSVAANLAGGFWGLRGSPNLRLGSYPTYIGALAALAAAWARLRGGEARQSSAVRLVDPRPERWGRESPASVLAQTASRAGGLSQVEASERLSARPPAVPQGALISGALAQLRSPLNGVLAGGAAVSLLVGEVADVVLIGAVIAVNTAVGVWQEHQADEAALALSRLGAAEATVLRDGEASKVAAEQVVVGDVLVLSSGDRVAADARVLSDEGFEVDEAALTGESLPVVKSRSADDESARVLLEGSDVTVGSATAVVVAVGEGTRMGATAAALRLSGEVGSPLGARLNRIMRQGIPIVGAGGALILLSGLLRGRPLGPQLGLAASVATAAVPEGLPLIAGVGEAAVARRLVSRNALVRRLSAVEALGRVDVACADKTGTLTEGRLSLTAIDDFETTAAASTGPVAPPMREILRIAALASPHPDGPDAAAHPTDVAIIQAALDNALGAAIGARRDAELAFDPTRSFHAARVGDEVVVKGAAEELLARCAAVRRGEREEALDDGRRAELLAHVERLGARGLRVLMVARGPRGAAVDDPQGLLAIGLVGLSDPLRANVASAIERCSEAGVRLVMLTGDHPSTAAAIAAEAGLEVDGDRVLNGSDLGQLDDAELDRRLARVSVIARITPLDKVRIVERLQAQGHTVAMTGDGVNDAPALRLADVGVAMGAHGTDVARQAADVILTDDDFSTLVEAFVEGRSFWLNIRRSLGLLLGGNLGEIAMMAGASVLGMASPLNTRQILAVNLVTDVLPALAVAAQQPEHRDLSALRREGESEIDTLLRRDVLRRAAATGAPSLAAYILSTRISSPAQASTVAFGSIVATQLAQTVMLGRAEGSLSRPVLGAVVLTGAFVAAAVSLPGLAGLLGFAFPSAPGLVLVAAAGATSVLLSSTPTSRAPRALVGRVVLPA